MDAKDKSGKSSLAVREHSLLIDRNNHIVVSEEINLRSPPFHTIVIDAFLPLYRLRQFFVKVCIEYVDISSKIRMLFLAIADIPVSILRDLSLDGTYRKKNEMRLSFRNSSSSRRKRSK